MMLEHGRVFRSLNKAAYGVDPAAVLCIPRSWGELGPKDFVHLLTSLAEATVQ